MKTEAELLDESRSALNRALMKQRDIFGVPLLSTDNVFLIVDAVDQYVDAKIAFREREILEMLKQEMALHEPARPQPSGAGE